MNLDNFPTDETALDMMSMVAPIYDKSHIAKWIYQVMGMEMGDAKRLFEELRVQISYETATWALKYHEKMYGIEVDEKEDIETRRFRLKAYRSFNEPINPEKIRRKIEKLTGLPTQVSESGVYCIDIMIQEIAGMETNRDILEETIKNMRPAHVAYAIFYLKEQKAVNYFGALWQDDEIFELRQVM